MVARTLQKRPAGRHGHASNARKDQQNTSGVWHGPALADSQQVVLSEVAEHAGNCSLPHLLTQHAREKPTGAEHSLSKAMLRSGILKTFKDYQTAVDMAGGAEDETMSIQGDNLRSMILEKIVDCFDTMGLVELHQIHTFSLLVDFHRGRDWGVKLLPASGAASSETDDLTPVEDSDEETEKLRQAWLRAATETRHAKQKLLDAKEKHDKACKFKTAAWQAYTSAQETQRSKAAAAYAAASASVRHSPLLQEATRSKAASA